MKNGTFILENRLGQTVRTVRWENSKLFAIYRLDTRRVEFVSDIKSLDQEGISYQLINELDRSDVTSRAAKIGEHGRLRFVSQVTDLASSTQLPKDDEDNRQFIALFKKTSAWNAGIMAAIIVLGWALTPSPKEQEMVVVKIQEQPSQVQKRKIVEMSQRKIEKQPVKNAKVARKPIERKIVVNNPVTKSNKQAVSKRPGLSLNNTAALSALGGMNKNSRGAGGLNLNAAKNSAGQGYSGVAAAGGHNRSVIGKGMLSYGVGSGGQAQGFGGYGTKGRGGGRPGYGTMNMAGSSDGYFQPLGEEALIEGGLDRDQISAVIQRNIGQVIYCYEQGLQVKPSLSGRVAVKFVINGSGRVSTARISNSSLRSDKVENCIVNRLKGFQFPKPSGNVDVRVTYPFVLKRLSQG